MYTHRQVIRSSPPHWLITWDVSYVSLRFELFWNSTKFDDIIRRTVDSLVVVYMSFEVRAALAMKIVV
jgi:hypothetical protein